MSEGRENMSSIIFNEEVDARKNGAILPKLEHIYLKVEGISRPNFSFYFMICLSTVIASYGLLANSTAVVIGAMLVAPLMGPIFGIALSLSVDDKKLLGHSFLAEISGIIAVIGLSYLIGSLPFRVDFGSEIIARTSPNLYDILIALASGLAGAYSFADERLSPALPGVAIATALVPPLATCGLCLAAGRFGWAWGAFLLFFANFICIELAAAIVFYFAGVKKRNEYSVHTVFEFFKKFGFRLIALVLVGVFLTSTLANMINSNKFQRQIRTELSNRITSSSGAQLSDIRFLKSGANTQVVATILTPREFDAVTVAELENNLRKTVSPNISLVIRSLLSKDMDRNGPEFIEEDERLNIENSNKHKILFDSISRLLAEQLKDIPGTALMDMSVNISGDKNSITAVIRTPVEIPPAKVAEIQSYLTEKLKNPTRLIVRSIISKDADANQFLYQPGIKDEELVGEQLEIYRNIEKELKFLIKKQVAGSNLTEFRFTEKDKDILVVADVRAPRVFNSKDVKLIEKELRKSVFPGIYLVIRTVVGGDASSEGFVVDFNTRGLFTEKKINGKKNNE
jgi:uncharacterized hydrophobic protein (TIGR00271 family)